MKGNATITPAGMMFDVDARGRGADTVSSSDLTARLAAKSAHMKCAAFLMLDLLQI